MRISRRRRRRCPGNRFETERESLNRDRKLLCAGPRTRTRMRKEIALFILISELFTFTSFIARSGFSRRSFRKYAVLCFARCGTCCRRKNNRNFFFFVEFCARHCFEILSNPYGYVCADDHEEY